MALWKTKLGCLAAGGILGGDADQFLGGVPKNVIVFALARVPCAVFKLHARIPW
jgi:hypothetical protein